MGIHMTSIAGNADDEAKFAHFDPRGRYDSIFGSLQGYKDHVIPYHVYGSCTI